ncbi:MAG TPA: hypothetical protein VGS20_11265 [Candidatus Acidoferrales bacterium]|nr:hypothetical protein [Candidatus Acidoferrales bacterium]
MAAGDQRDPNHLIAPAEVQSSLLPVTVLLVLAVLFATAVLLAAAALLSPVVLILDSACREIRVCWLLALEYRRPLPGIRGEPRLLVAGKPIHLRMRKPKPPAPAAAASRPPLEPPLDFARDEPRRKHPRLNRFFMRCLRNSTIRRALARQSVRLVKATLRSAALTRWRASVSLPDPAASGMLAGGLAAAGWGGQARVRVNFQGENSLFFEIRLYPHRLVKAALLFLARLPYRVMFREWRACSERAA